MKAIFRKSLVVICFLSLARCASVPKKPKVVVNPLEDRIAVLEISLRDQSQEISRLRGVINSLTPKKTTTAAQVSAPETNQEPIKNLPTTKLKPENSDEIRAVSPLMEDAETIVDSSQDTMHTYYRGLQFLNDKKYEEAIEAFRSFINESPKHVYADRAQFLIADSHFKNKDYGMVVVATNLLETKFPYSLKIPEALYRRGISFAEMNQMAQAKLTFGNLMKNFPKDPMADAARRKWVELAKENPTRIQ
jgi:TolA-binding protein